MDELQRQLEDAFHASSYQETVRGVREGILLGDDLIENTPMLRHPGGRDLRGHIRRAGIMFRIRDLCQRGDLPFSSEIVAMPHGNWHWLEVRSGNFKAHVCRSDGPYEFPEETLSRQDSRLANQFELFAPNVVSITDLIGKIREFYAWLTFSADRSGTLKHVCWAMPPSDGGAWLAHIDVLGRVQRIVGEVTVEEPAKVFKLRFRDHIEEALAQRGETDKQKES